MNKKRVVVGMSGGVDSSVAAYILKEQGYEVIGVTMQIWPDQDEAFLETQGGCCSLSAVEDARRVANHLDIPHYVMNFKDVFEKKVIDYFVDEYLAGRTPNPCIACNRFIKFEELLRRAMALDAFYVATGHYARIEYDPGRQRYLLKKSPAQEKDQTYVLYGMTQYQLEHTLMPLGNYTKKQTREISRKIGLPVAQKPDSQEICFVPDNDYAGFIKRRVPEDIKPGYFIDMKGNVLGKHKGIVHYTIGQRRGLGIALGRPMYVVDIDSDRNVVVLGENHEVFSRGMVVKDVNLISLPEITRPVKVKAKVRYTAKEALATIYPLEGGKIKVIFEQPQRAITPGQAAVFYEGDIVVGGGTIAERIK